MRRSSSTIPFGYKISDKDVKILEEIPEELEVLSEIKGLVSSKVLSLREGSAWIEHKTGRKLSHVGLKKMVDNERLGS
tara:strand:+ start:443 stop:676 length:234 start_codon:yes stop_codon:yes gene_type:complete